MQSFIAIHSNAQGPAFTTFETIQEAKTYLQSLLHANKVDADDTLAIVRSNDDSIIYFKKRNNTVASLNAALGSRDAGFSRSTHSMAETAKERLMLAFSTLTNAMSRW